MGYAADPGGKFSSDVHRRVLGHLSLPSDKYGWSSAALLNRMIPDVGTNLQSTEELGSVLEELAGEGYAQDNGNDVWQMTDHGFEALTAEVPQLESTAVAPAMVSLGATNLNNEPTPVE